MKTLQSGMNITSLITDAIAKHFNVPGYQIHCKINLGRNNPYKKHSTPVEVIIGIRLKNFVPELNQESLENLQLEG